MSLYASVCNNTVVVLTVAVAAPNSAYLNQAFLTICAGGRAGEFPWGRPIDLKQLLMW